MLFLHISALKYRPPDGLQLADLTAAATAQDTNDEEEKTNAVSQRQINNRSPRIMSKNHDPP